jgi:hypothetical protein
VTITTRKAPPAGASVLRRGLSDLSSTGEMRTMAGGFATDAASNSIPLYVLGLSDLAHGEGLNAAHQVGWRYLVYGPDTVGIADLDQSGGGENLEFSGLHTGERARCLNAALTFADQNYQSARGSYEIRALEIPALYTAALWLDGDDDTVIIPFLKNGTLCHIAPVSTQQFFDEVGGRARSQLELLARDGNPRALESE